MAFSGWEKFLKPKVSVIQSRELSAIARFSAEPFTYVIFFFGSKQYRVKIGDSIKLDKISFFSKVVC